MQTIGVVLVWGEFKTCKVCRVPHAYTNGEGRAREIGCVRKGMGGKGGVTTLDTYCV